MKRCDRKQAEADPYAPERLLLALSDDNYLRLVNCRLRALVIGWHYPKRRMVLMLTKFPANLLSLLNQLLSHDKEGVTMYYKLHDFKGQAGALLGLVMMLNQLPMIAAEVELWQGFRFGMSKQQVQATLKEPIIKCEQGARQGLLLCVTKSYLPLGNKKASARTIYENNRLSKVFLRVEVENYCKFDIKESRKQLGIKNRTPEEILADAKSYFDCLNPYEADNQIQIRAISESLTQKYGQSTGTPGSRTWKAKGTIIELKYLITGIYFVSYAKDATYGSL